MAVGCCSSIPTSATAAAATITCPTRTRCTSLGDGEYVDLLRRLAESAPHDDRDRLREQGMAFHLHEARKTGARHDPEPGRRRPRHPRRRAPRVRTAPPLARQRRTTGRHPPPRTPTASPRCCPIRRWPTRCGKSSAAARLPEEPDLFAHRRSENRGVVRTVDGHRRRSQRDALGERQHQVASYAAHHASRLTQREWAAVDRERPAGSGVAGRHRLPSRTDANRNHTLAAPALLRFRPPLRQGPGTAGARSLRDGGRRPRCRRRQPGVGDLRRRPMLPVAGTDRRDRDRSNRRRGARSRDADGEVSPPFPENQATTPGGPGPPPPVPGRSGRLAPRVFGRGHLFLPTGRRRCGGLGPPPQTEGGVRPQCREFAL